MSWTLIEIRNFVKFFSDVDLILARFSAAARSRESECTRRDRRESNSRLRNLRPSGATPSTSVMNWNALPFQVKIIGQDPERRCASAMVSASPLFLCVSFWIRPFGQVMRIVSASACPSSRKRKRHALIDALIVERSGFHLDRRAHGFLDVLDALNANCHPALSGRRIEVEMKRAVGQNARIVFPVVAVEVGANRRGAPSVRSRRRTSLPESFCRRKSCGL